MPDTRVPGGGDPVDPGAPAAMHHVGGATGRLVATLTRRGADLGGPSALPGWTRGHVATHIARNADSFTWLLDGAVAGEVRDQYPGGPATRAAAIAAGADRPAEELVADVVASAARLAAACARMPAEAWSRTVRMTSAAVPASQLPVARLREVEVHHVDLDLGYRPWDWSVPFVDGELEVRVAGMGPRLPLGTAVRVVATDRAGVWEIGEGPASVSVTGPGAVLLSWLLGRDTGGRLDAPDGLPSLAPW